MTIFTNNKDLKMSQTCGMVQNGSLTGSNGDQPVDFWGPFNVSFQANLDALIDSMPTNSRCGGVHKWEYPKKR